MSSLPTQTALQAERFGDYQVTGVIARGGMGIVYRGEHEATGARVAIKTVRAPHGDLVTSMRREVSALVELDHPGIVSVVDHGTHGGIPWYAMELLEGDTLADLLGRVGLGDPTPGGEATLDYLRSDAPAPARAEGTARPGISLEQGVHLIRRLCAPLAWLHGEGIVHRDLKPANVFVRDGWPVLVDFGLVQHFAGADSRERIDGSDGPMAGSPSYLSPEQIRGGGVDPRADIYALGCILYEVLTGAPPFRGATMHVINQHLRAAPDPPSLRVPGIPSSLDDLVLRLLAKEPRVRVGHAVDVARALAAIVPPPPDEVPPSSGAPRTWLYRPSLVGREAAMARLDDGLVADRVLGQPLLLVEGPSGIGKTRLLSEFARNARSFGYRVVKGACEPRVGQTVGRPLHPLKPVLDAVADHCRESGGDETRRVVGPRGSLLREYAPALGDLPGVPRNPAAHLDSPEAARLRLVHWLAETLVAFARHRPLLVLLDDVQWADELSIAFLRAVADGEVCLPGVVLACATRAEGTALDPVRSAPSTRTIEIGPLGRPAIEQIVAEMLAVDVPPQPLVDRLVAESEGNPFYVGEFLHAAVVLGRMTRDEAGRWHYGEGGLAAALDGGAEVPRTAGELVALRLDALDRADRELAAAAAILGATFDFGPVPEIAGVDEDAALASLAHLVVRGVVAEAEGGRYRFAHAKVQAAVIDGMPRERRVALHVRAAEVLAAGAAPDARAIAAHWEAAGEPGRAWPWLLRAGHEAHAMCAYDDARKLLAAAFEAEAQAPAGARLGAIDRARAALARAEAVFGAGENARAEALALPVLADMGVTVPASRWGWASRVAIELLRQGVHLVIGPARWTGERLERALLVVRGFDLLSLVYLTAARQLEQLGAAAIAVNLLDRAGDAAPTALPYASLGLLVGMFGLDRLGRRYFDRALANPAARAEAGRVRSHRALVWLCRGEWAVLEQDRDEMLASCRETGDVYALSVCGIYLAGAAAVRGRPSDGIGDAARAREVAERYGFATERQHGALSEAGLYGYARRPDRMRSLLGAIAKQVDEGGDPVGRALFHACDAVARRLEGQPEQALAALDRTWSLLRTQPSGSPGYLVPLVHSAWVALWLFALGHADALDRVDEAAVRLRRGALLQPACRQFSLLLTGCAAARRGRRARARRLLRRATRGARAQQLTVVEAVAMSELADLDGSDDLREQARALLEEGGAAWPPLHHPETHP